MNVEFINPFVETINNILATMASMSCEYGKPYLKEGRQPLGVVTGIIPMSGDSVRGSLAISFSAGAIIKISSSMLGESIAEVDETCHDLTGELTNMLSGGARKLLWEKGYDFDMAKPGILSGEMDIPHETTGPVLVIPFETSAGPFFIEVALSSSLKRAVLNA
ncbi:MULTISPECIES: chemotaxis protein CheX [Oceanospirillaceae]|jgi:chemotaxis protein CheX|uniref:chemotaxis protein CheX n=1 Tax=Oceanospirillaceae TaxID=135620 RepID=UPI001197961F|nr:MULTISPECIES: chemotaxis protein CheX [Thalassolituus]MCB2386863.1 chemotaxis protein CheX [Thalassolituus alkanivorans]MCB2425022.1 chemotaxis protein CheX [Thalassolituus alkanivorans]TVV44132.1 chemotaxis protein CheX [Thalassolituus sp. C2-1]